MALSLVQMTRTISTINLPRSCETIEDTTDGVEPSYVRTRRVPESDRRHHPQHDEHGFGRWRPGPSSPNILDRATNPLHALEVRAKVTPRKSQAGHLPDCRAALRRRPYLWLACEHAQIA